MLYVEPVYRPPSEAESLLVQASVGCLSAARGQCYFCGSWLLDRVVPEKKFRVRPASEVKADLEEARRRLGPGVRRVFLLDSNALVMRTASLVEICRHAYRQFPDLERVSVYACAADILRKSEASLREIRQAGLKLLYLGLESGNEEVLRMHNKGATAEEAVRACSRAMAAGFEVSTTVILGLGGKALSRAHAADTGRVLSRIQPRYVGALTLMVVPGTPVEEWLAADRFQMLSQLEILEELRELLEHFQANREVVFRTNHASNYLPLRGTLPRDRDRLLRTIGQALDHKVPLRPERARGL